MTRIVYLLLRLGLQRYRGREATDLLEIIETDLRAYGHHQPACYPPEYSRRLGMPWCWFAAILHRRDPAAFWSLQRRWAWSRLNRIDWPVMRSYEQGGLEFNLDIRHKNPFEHYFGFFEFGLLQRLLELLRPNDIVFDVGANCGLFSLTVAQHLALGRVIAFEPNPEMVELIRSHAKRNALCDNVQILPFALGVEDTILKLSIPPHNPGGASLVWTRPDNGIIDVTVRDFRQLCHELGNPVAQLVKIDVEGFEPEVIEAMSDYLAVHGPLLLIELSPAAYDAHRLVERLHDLGYDRIRRLRDDGNFDPLPYVFSEQINVLCEMIDQR